MSGWLSGLMPGNMSSSLMSLNLTGQGQGLSSRLSTTGFSSGLQVTAPGRTAIPASTMSRPPAPPPANVPPQNVQAEIGQMVNMLMTMLQAMSSGQQQPGMAAPAAPGMYQQAAAPTAAMSGQSMVGSGLTIGGVPIPTTNGQLGPQGLYAIDLGLNNTMGIIQNSLASVRLGI